MNWIKTSERLPEIGKAVVISSATIKEFAFLGSDGSWRDNYGDLLYPTIVEYWIELPPLPEEAK